MNLEISLKFADAFWVVASKLAHRPFLNLLKTLVARSVRILGLAWRLLLARPHFPERHCLHRFFKTYFGGFSGSWLVRFGSWFSYSVLTLIPDGFSLGHRCLSRVHRVEPRLCSESIGSDRLVLLDAHELTVFGLHGSIARWMPRLSLLAQLNVWRLREASDQFLWLAAFMLY